MLLKRLPASGEIGAPAQGWSEVTRGWERRTVVCMATGPSLTIEQVARACISEAMAIVCNDNYLLAPWADVLYFPDRKWWQWHKDRPEFKAFAGIKVALSSVGELGVDDPNLHYLRHGTDTGLSLDPKALNTGSNSGHQMINIAVLSGAARILLLGYDGKRAADGKKHHFGEHPDRTEPPYEVMLRYMKTIPPVVDKLGVRIINCTPGSAIDCFERMDLDEALCLESDTQRSALQA